MNKVKLDLHLDFCKALARQCEKKGLPEQAKRVVENGVIARQNFEDNFIKEQTAKAVDYS